MRQSQLQHTMPLGLKAAVSNYLPGVVIAALVQVALTCAYLSVHAMVWARSSPNGNIVFPRNTVVNMVTDPRCGVEAGDESKATSNTEKIRQAINDYRGFQYGGDRGNPLFS